MDGLATGSGEFELRRRLLQMEMLHEVGLALHGSLDPVHVAEEILQRALTMVDARAGALWVREADGNLAQVAVAGFAAAALTGLQTILSQGGVPVQLQQVAASPPVGACLCLVPLTSSDAVVGVLVVADREARGSVGPFKPEDEALLHAFANQAGAALHNARLHRDLESAYAALQEAQKKVAQLEQLRALGDVAAEVTHAMRHVLGIIVGRADIYLTFPSDPEQTVRSILEGAAGGQQIIDRIDQFTRLGVGRQRGWVDLPALLRQTAEGMQALWRQRTSGSAPAVTWTMDLPPLPPLWANRTDLGDAFGNLLLNALEAMPSGGTMSVRCALQADEYRIEVSDTGTGMTEEVRQRRRRRGAIRPPSALPATVRAGARRGRPPPQPSPARPEPIRRQPPGCPSARPAPRRPCGRQPQPPMKKTPRPPAWWRIFAAPSVSKSPRSSSFSTRATCCSCAVTGSLTMISLTPAAGWCATCLRRGASPWFG